MSKSTHQIAVKAVDQTAGGFASIQARAAAASAKIRGMMGGAIAAAGAYLGMSAIKGGIDELGHLSDVAMKTSTSVGELTGAVQAMNVLGIQNMSVEQLAKSFDYMAKTTGRAGMQGFYQTIGELGKIPDVALRGQEAMRIFGRSGMEFMPLINAADLGTQALSDLIQAMPQIPQAAADAGDAAADAMAIAAQGVKSVWLQGLAAICGWFDNEYQGGIRQASASAANYLEYYAKLGVSKAITAFQKLQKYLERFGEYWGTLIGTKVGGGSWRDALVEAEKAWQRSVREYSDTSVELDAKEKERTERFRRNFEDRQIVVEKLNKSYANAAISTEQRNLRNGAELDDLGNRAPTIRNELMLGGSAKSLAAAMVGPTLQSETKKQTRLLETIATNTKSTADNTEKTADESNDLEVLN